MTANRELLGSQLSRHVDKYDESHRKRVNRLLHYVGIPLAALAALGLLSKIAWPMEGVPHWLQPNLGMAALLGPGAWYMWWRPLVGILMLAIGAAGYVVSTMFSAWLLAALGVAAIALHFIGHYGFEGKPPQLFRRPVSVIEAPIWLLARLFGWAKEQIDER
jgi:uncharacterized membrane protein YGL010W